jgi:hypothetical protein
MASSKRGAATTGKLFVAPGFKPGISRCRSVQVRPPHQGRAWSIPLSTEIYQRSRSPCPISIQDTAGSRNRSNLLKTKDRAHFYSRQKHVDFDGNLTAPGRKSASQYLYNCTQPISSTLSGDQ